MYIYPSPVYPLIDAHTHIGNECEMNERRQKCILSLVCASTPSEADVLLKKAIPYILPTAGLHPWKAASYSVDDMLPYLHACSVIGEIGMDNVWCSVDLKLQEKVFRRQLSIAQKMKKPVILHTKGEEDRISSIISEYPNIYLVHWYSCEKYLESYIELGCYFSVGPDVLWNPSVRALAERVPLSRILIETDGMDAVRWAYDAGCDQANEQYENLASLKNSLEKPESVENALINTLLETAAIRKTDPDILSRQIQRNLINGFLSPNNLPDLLLPALSQS